MFPLNENRETVELEGTLYEIDISLLQIEVTNKCNFACKHCREGTTGYEREICSDDIVKTIDFIRCFNPKFSEVTLSGGEPLMATNLFDVLSILEAMNIQIVHITTNASLLTGKMLDRISLYNFKEVNFSVSIEFLEKAKFNAFRGNEKAYDSVFVALNLISTSKYKHITSSLRVSLLEENVLLNKLEKFTISAIENKCKSIKFTPILPVGRAGFNGNYISKVSVMRQLDRCLYTIYDKYSDKIKVETNDPLLFIKRKSKCNNSLSGCGAGLISLNLLSDGNLTICSLMPYTVLCNVRNLNTGNIIQKYKESEVIKRLIKREYIGKCRWCDKKYICGGCRARCLAITGNMWESDSLCFY